MFSTKIILLSFQLLLELSGAEFNIQYCHEIPLRFNPYFLILAYHTSITYSIYLLNLVSNSNTRHELIETEIYPKISCTYSS